MNHKDLTYNRFKSFLETNKTLLISSLLFSLIQFSIFKYLYPFASYIHGDSFSYIRAAEQNNIISTYPIGYSKFLRLFSVITKSDTALTFFQYLFVHISGMFFASTLTYLFTLNKKTFFIIITLLTLNPLLIVLGNLVSSDCIFVALSFLWLSTLLWTCLSYSRSILLIHSFILLACFTVRYNAIIYPFISILSVFIASNGIINKLKISIPIILPTLTFIFFTIYQYKIQTNTWQFSPFSGWQLANNAMYAIKFVDNSDLKPISKKYEGIDTLVRKYFSIYGDTAKYSFEKEMASTYYMWSPGMPLMTYKRKVFSKDSTTSEFKKWAQMGPYYKGYGKEVIMKHPLPYFKYFILPNTLKYYSPPTEFLEYYNQNRNYVDSSAIRWFDYKSKFVKIRGLPKFGNVLMVYPMISGAVNLMMLMTLISIFFLKGFKNDETYKLSFYVGCILWITNAFFTILVSSAALRFQTFPILSTAIFTIIYIEWITKKGIVNIKNKEHQISLPNA